MQTAKHVTLPEWGRLPPLPSGEVRVHTAHLSEASAVMEQAEGMLSAVELERAGKIRVERARMEFVLGRAILRAAVGAAMQCQPRLVEFQVSQYGKPFARGVHSNVTHSQGLIYVALCQDMPVGIDVEWIDPKLEVMELAKDNFAPEEIAYLAALLPGSERARGFCQLWTRKEAIAKADGRGLRIPLHDIKVPQKAVGVGRISAVSTWRNDDSAGENYFVQDLIAPFGFVAALAIKGSALPVKISPLLPH